MDSTTPYDYSTVGFSPFLTRSIDDVGLTNLDQIAASAQQTTRELNYDQSATTGSLGSFLRIGSIILDGAKGRITIVDENGKEAVWIGDIDG